MKKVGRNAPCPCGSGRKYKLCCREREEGRISPPPTEAPDWFEDNLVEDSNRVLDLLDAGQIDEAEQAADFLLEHYPGVPDGWERTAAVLDARGENARAAMYYRKAAAKYVELDPEEGHHLAVFCLKRAGELEKRVEEEG